MAQRVAPLGVTEQQAYHPAHPSARIIADDSIVFRDSSPSIISPDGIDERVQEDLYARCKRNGFPIFVAIMLVAGTIASASIFFMRNGRKSKDASTLSEGGGATDTPDITGMDEDGRCFVGEIFLNCARGLPIVIPECLIDGYNNYKANWIPIHDPTFDHEIDSCAPANLGLISLASRTLQHLDDEHKYALTAFFVALNGTNWFDRVNWLSTLPLTEWTGIEVNQTSGEVLGIKLINNFVSGTLPPQIALLTNMESINLDDNAISGSIPTSYGVFKDLSLASNKLTGTIPLAWSKSSTLRSLDFDSNFLAGSVPHMALLEKLILARNELTSTITVGTNLYDLDLSQNRFTGTMQAHLGTSLTRLNLENNIWDDAVISLDVLKQLPNLKYLQLGGTNLRGTIPTEIGNMHNLTWWQMAGNQINGSLPTQVAQLSNVELMDLEYNLLSGNIPTEVGAMTKLENLYLTMNKFSGALPSELGQLKKLRTFIFSGNHMSGVIPKEVCNLWDDGDLESLGDVASNCGAEPSAGIGCPTEACCRNCRGIEIVPQPQGNV